MTINLDALRAELDATAPGDRSGYYVRGAQVVAARRRHGGSEAGALVVRRVWLDDYGIAANHPHGPRGSAPRYFAVEQIHKKPGVGWLAHGAAYCYQTIGEALEAARTLARGTAPASRFTPR